MPKFLIIQTAFIGDVVLATALAEKIHQCFPEGNIDFLVRKGNETLLENHPFVKTVFVWNKGNKKYQGLFDLLRVIRKEKYDYVVNPHRFASSGFITAFSGAKNRYGFDKNPFSLLFTQKIKHEIGQNQDSKHEVERNQLLIRTITDEKPALPKLYPDTTANSKIKIYQTEPYLCIAPSSVWFTKQFPISKWVELIKSLPEEYKIFLLGGPSDISLAIELIQKTGRSNIENLCGCLSYLESAALMQGAIMNYVNDSAPLHFATAVNAKVTAIFCSTIPEFGFGPLSTVNKIVQIEEKLYCRPCGLHGKKSCPQGHFRCALEIKNESLLWWISKKI